MPYFPMFVDLENKSCLIVGGGSVAMRKAKALKDFGAKVIVAAPEIMPEIKSLAGVSFLERDFEAADLERMDLEGMALVVAATDDKELNHQVAKVCRAQKIPVNAVDQIEDCSFIFPAYLRTGEVVAAFSSSGSSPVIAQYLKEKMRPEMTEHLGRVADCLGSLRTEVKGRIATEAKRKAAYQELLHLAMDEDRLLSKEKIEAIICKYQKGEGEEDGANKEAASQ